MTLPIAGLQKTTLLDYPGIVASTIFLAGCNFRCSFCHNSQMIDNSSQLSFYTEEDIFSHLYARKNVVKGVCITGGEPTLYDDVVPFIQKIKDLGYLVKLDTNGTNPLMLNKLLSDGLLDYVAMDIKNDSANYFKICGFSDASTFHPFLQQVKESISLLKNSNIPYEFRTTCVKGLHTADSFHGICELTGGGMMYALQNFKDSDHVPNHQLQGFSDEELKLFQSICLPHFDSVILRM